MRDYLKDPYFWLVVLALVLLVVTVVLWVDSLTGVFGMIEPVYEQVE